VGFSPKNLKGGKFGSKSVQKFEYIYRNILSDDRREQLFFLPPICKFGYLWQVSRKDNGNLITVCNIAIV
jgi:hypothetical protein